MYGYVVENKGGVHEKAIRKTSKRGTFIPCQQGLKMFFLSFKHLKLS